MTEEANPDETDEDTEYATAELRTSALANSVTTATPETCRRYGHEPAEVYDYQRTRAIASVAGEIERYIGLLRSILTGGLLLGAVLLGWELGDVLAEVLDDANHHLRGLA
jgi:hypothetical protein